VAVTDRLGAAANPAMLAALLASFGCAALLLAAGRLAAALTGVPGRVALAAGSLCSVLFALYYGAFGAAATVATMQFDTTSAGLGEATLLATNMISFGRYGAGFALLLAAAVTWRRRALPVWLSVVAGVLAVATALPFTSWIAALAVPVWLGVAGALARPRD
jgi:hypothetical protein